MHNTIMNSRWEETSDPAWETTRIATYIATQNTIPKAIKYATRTIAMLETSDKMFDITWDATRDATYAAIGDMFSV